MIVVVAESFGDGEKPHRSVLVISSESPYKLVSGGPLRDDVLYSIRNPVKVSNSGERNDGSSGKGLTKDTHLTPGVVISYDSSTGTVTPVSSEDLRALTSL